MLRRQHLLRAAGEQRDARAPFALRGEHLRPIDRGGRRQACRREREHAGEARGQQMAERARRAEPREREAEQPGPRQHRGQQRAQQPVRPAAVV